MHLGQLGAQVGHELGLARDVLHGAEDALLHAAVGVAVADIELHEQVQQHAERGQRLVRRNGDVRRREADGAPDLLALFNAPRNAVAASEQVVDLVHIALRKQAADARGRYRFAVNHDFRHNDRAETVLLAVLLEHLSIAFAARAKGEIKTAHNHNRCVHLHQFRLRFRLLSAFLLLRLSFRPVFQWFRRFHRNRFRFRLLLDNPSLRKPNKLHLQLQWFHP